MPSVRIRGGAQKIQPYPINEFRDRVIQSIGERIVHLLAVGVEDVTGDQFSKFFAESISGKMLAQPVGIADVTWKRCCWSAKTVKRKNPQRVNQVRLIAGRNSPVFSASISDHSANIQKTGDAVVEIYNQRVYEAQKKHGDLRLLVLIRDMDSLNFSIFERSISPFSVNDYEWRKNKRNNLEAYDGDRHAFTWQPHGSQFTIVEKVPASARKFQICRRPDPLPVGQILDLVKYEPSWIVIK